MGKPLTERAATPEDTIQLWVSLSQTRAVKPEDTIQVWVSCSFFFCCFVSLFAKAFRQSVDKYNVRREMETLVGLARDGER